MMPLDLPAKRSDIDRFIPPNGSALWIANARATYAFDMASALEQRIEAHVFVAFMAYCLHVTLRARLRPLAAGLTPRAVLDKFAAIQMLDVHFPTTDGRTLILSRYTQLNTDQNLLVRQLKLTLPPQPPPRITAACHLARARM
jgi:hypothetical protein